MGVIVLQETGERVSTDREQGGTEEHGEEVHAAVPDPSGAVADQTLCDKPTADMQRLTYQPGSPDDPWYPDGLEERVCRRCDQAVAQ